MIKSNTGTRWHYEPSLKNAVRLEWLIPLAFCGSLMLSGCTSPNHGSQVAPNPDTVRVFSEADQKKTIVVDPVADFPTRRASRDFDKLLKVEVDFANIGQRVMFLSLSHNVAGKAGNIWTAYIPTTGGYVKVENASNGESIVFRKDYSWLGRFNGHSNSLLMNYWPGGAGKGTLVGYGLVGTTIQATVLKSDIEPDGADKALFDNIFTPKTIMGFQELDLPK